jgi:hypothetical protein
LFQLSWQTLNRKTEAVNINPQFTVVFVLTTSSFCLFFFLLLSAQTSTVLLIYSSHYFFPDNKNKKSTYKRIINYKNYVQVTYETPSVYFFGRRCIIFEQQFWSSDGNEIRILRKFRNIRISDFHIVDFYIFNQKFKFFVINSIVNKRTFSILNKKIIWTLKL